MIKNPIILWIILAIQLVFLAMFIFNMVKLALDGMFFPMFAVDFVLTLVLLWVTASHIKLLSKTQTTNTDPFS